MSFIEELKRRNVIRVGIAYIVGAWLLAQAADLVLDVLGAPDVILQSLVSILALGFIPAVIFAWAFEMTPEGIKKEKDVDRTQSITNQTAKKLDIATMVLVVAAVGLLALDRFIPGDAGGRLGADNRTDAGDRLAGDNDNRAQGAILQEGADSNSPSFQTGVAVSGIQNAKSIAVLPFANRSNQNDDLYFTDGIHDDLLTQLAKIGDLTVISRTSVMEYRDSTKNIRQIARELNVQTIMEGGIQKVGDRVRINVQLIEADSDRHLWAETYDRELTAENIFELQSEITRKIVAAVAGTLTPEEEQLLSDVPTRNLAAYDAYLRARALVLGANYSHSNIAEARPLAEKAVELDPDYAEAHALLADIYGDYYWRGIEQSASFVAKYRTTVDRVNTLAPGSATALLAEANFQYRVEFDYPRSLELLQQAQQVAPGDSRVFAALGTTQRRLGLWDAAIDNLQRALALDPASRGYQNTMVETLYGNFRFQDVLDNTIPLEDADRNEADSQIIRALAQFQLTGDLAPLGATLEYVNPTASTLYLHYAPTYHLYRRDAKRALAALEGPAWTEALETDSGWRFVYLDLKSISLRLLGDIEAANEAAEQLVGMLRESENLPPQDRFYGYLLIAGALAHLGHADEARAMLGRADRMLENYQDAVVLQVYFERKAMILALLGESEQALSLLRQAMSTKGSNNPVTPLTLQHDPNWDFFRDNPEFDELSTPDLRVLELNR